MHLIVFDVRNWFTSCVSIFGKAAIVLKNCYFKFKAGVHDIARDKKSPPVTSEATVI